MPRRPGGPAGRPTGRTLWIRHGLPHPALRVAVLVALLAAVFGILRVTDQPGLAVALYGLVPIVLGVYWFALTGGLLTAAIALGCFLVDESMSPTPSFSTADVVLATVNRALVFSGVAVLVAVLLERERGMAARLQAQEAELAELAALRAVLVPAAVPPRPHLDVATAFAPADGPVAGDFYLVTDGPGGCTTVVVGDVVGHGLEAARVAAFVRATLATLAHFTADPAQLLQLADTALAERGDPEPTFVTAVCAVLDGGPGHRLRWAAAGHPVPWVLDTGAPLPDGAPGVPLGIRTGELGVATATAALAPGAGVLLFTDGLVEGRAAGSRGAGLFGEERARQVVRDHPGASPQTVVSALVDSVTAFAGGHLADDLCVVALRST
ncbi:PP2C family protein-serine/threonine phosphatase [Blastococcus sp. SYSU D00669]